MIEESCYSGKCTWVRSAAAHSAFFIFPVYLYAAIRRVQMFPGEESVLFRLMRACIRFLDNSFNFPNIKNAFLVISVWVCVCMQVVASDWFGAVFPLYKTIVYWRDRCSAICFAIRDDWFIHCRKNNRKMGLRKYGFVFL